MRYDSFRWKFFNGGCVIELRRFLSELVAVLAATAINSTCRMRCESRSKRRLVDEERRSGQSVNFSLNFSLLRLSWCSGKALNPFEGSP